ncbi:MAG: FAD-dependent oxidoreductase [Acidobacteria bacterium]|nr:MAG: FAD-dependent oxidoreductase [Acidobacteriota bacterium]
MASERIESASFWHDTLEPGDDLAPRPPLAGDADVDVAIVGAGFTGLWTAHSLLRADPSIRVTIFERETAGFGASGRNGGWCVGDFGGPVSAVERKGGPGSVDAMFREMYRSVDDVGSVVAAAGIDCGFHKGGALYVATNSGQMRRVRHHYQGLLRYGQDDAWQLLDASAAKDKVNMAGIRGALFTPHAAALHPARLARGLAREVERLGGVIYEGTRIKHIEKRKLAAEGGTVRADVIVRATEAYTSTIDCQEREVLALGNYMIATEPIDDAMWEEIGLADRELFELSAILLGYGQRTSDGRIAWGGLGAPTWWKGRIPQTPMRNVEMEHRLRRALGEMFPPLKEIGVSHHWGGVLGVPRDLLPGVGYDRELGFAWGGGYTGQGVAAANAAGRTLADLIRGEESELTSLPWVGHRSKKWEPEPLQWMGVHAVTAGARVVDEAERAVAGLRGRA